MGRKHNIGVTERIITSKRDIRGGHTAPFPDPRVLLLDSGYAKGPEF